MVTTSRLRFVPLVVGVALAAGCASNPPPQAPVAPAVAEITPSPPPPAPPPMPTESAAEPNGLPAMQESSMRRSEIPAVDLSEAAAGGLAGLGTPKNWKGTVSIGTAAVNPPITDSERVVAGLRPRFRNCYNQTLLETPSMSGKLTLTGKIAANGEVASTSASGASAGISRDLERCVKSALLGATFGSAGANGATVVIPMTFSLTKP